MRGRAKQLGEWGETKACEFLERKGFRVIDRNFHTTVGEIDIIAKFRDDFYFVEVKTRLAGEMAYDLSVTNDKKRKMRKTIASYCAKRNIRDAGIIPVSLMVVVDKPNKKVSFRLAVIY